MDTYFHTNFNCVKCGRCVIACQEEGSQFIVGVRDNCPIPTSDYVPCHHCTDRFSKVPPCKDVCFYDAIEITRW